jgi:hypothetical protein
MRSEACRGKRTYRHYLKVCKTFMREFDSHPRLERRSFIIEKRGTPKGVLMSIRDYVKLAAPELVVLRIMAKSR